MPNIETYTNKVDAPRASDLGAEAFDQEGRRVGAFYHQIGENTGGVVAQLGDQYVAHETHVETAQLGADLADAHYNLAQQWNHILGTTDPKDIQKAADDFRENTVKPTLDKLGENLTTEGAQDTFTKASAGLKDELFQKTAADTAKAVADGTVNNVFTIRNQASNSVLADPTSFSAMEALVHTTFDGVQKAGLLQTPGQRDTLEKGTMHDVATSAAMGYINQNPQNAIDVLKSGKFSNYLNGEETNALIKSAEEHIRAADTQSKANDAEARRAQKDASDSFLAKAQAAIIQPDGSLKLTPDSMRAATNYMTMPGVTPAEGRAAVDFFKKVADDAIKGVKPVSDPHTYSDLLGRLALPPGSPNAVSQRDLFQAFSTGHLSQHDYTFFTNTQNKLQADPAGRANENAFNDFMKSQKSAITHSNPLMGMLDGVGDQQYYQFQHDARAQWDAAIQAGAKPDDLLNPTSKQYLGRMVGRYQIGTNQATDLVTGANGGTVHVAPVPAAGTVKRNPGESAADFLKRTGG